MLQQLLLYFIPIYLVSGKHPLKSFMMFNYCFYSGNYQVWIQLCIYQTLNLAMKYTRLQVIIDFNRIRILVVECNYLTDTCWLLVFLRIIIQSVFLHTCALLCHFLFSEICNIYLYDEKDKVVFKSYYCQHSTIKACFDVICFIK